MGRSTTILIVLLLLIVGGLFFFNSQAEPVPTGTIDTPVASADDSDA